MYARIETKLCCVSEQLTMGGSRDLPAESVGCLTVTAYQLQVLSCASVCVCV